MNTLSNDEIRDLLRIRKLEYREALSKFRFLRNNCDTIVLVSKRLSGEQYMNVLKELKLKVKTLKEEINILYAQAYPDHIPSNKGRVLYRLDKVLNEL